MFQSNSETGARQWSTGIGRRASPERLLRSLTQLCADGSSRRVFKYLAHLEVRGLGHIHPIHVSGFIHHRRTVDRVVPGTLFRNLLGIELLYRFRSEGVDSLGFHLALARLVGGRPGWLHRTGAFNGGHTFDPTCSGEINFKVSDTQITIQKLFDHYADQNPAIDQTDGVSLDFGWTS